MEMPLQRNAAEDTAIDPVCGMKLDLGNSPHRYAHYEHDYHFCSAGCRGKFVADPDKYVPKANERPPSHEGIVYTCPMHPQIRLNAPGNCPICGMALEPLTAGESGPSPELIDMTRRFWIGTALAVPTVILEMGGHFPGLELHRYISPQISVWLQFLLATPVVLWAGWPFFVRGWASVRN